VQYWVKIVFVDNQELLVKDAVRHTISDDMEVLEVDSAKEVIIVPMKQLNRKASRTRILRALLFFFLP
jgi:hypothetical protein